VPGLSLQAVFVGRPCVRVCVCVCVCVCVGFCRTGVRELAAGSRPRGAGEVVDDALIRVTRLIYMSASTHLYVYEHMYEYHPPHTYHIHHTNATEHILHTRNAFSTRIPRTTFPTHYTWAWPESCSWHTYIVMGHTYIVMVHDSGQMRCEGLSLRVAKVLHELSWNVAHESCHTFE